MADALYGCVAGFGLTFISNALVSQQVWIRLIGGLILCYLGVRTLLAKPAEHPASLKGAGLAGAFVSTFFLTLSNPMTILSFAAIFAGLGMADGSQNYGGAGVLILGVFAGSVLWWFVLSAGVGLLRMQFTARAFRWVNIVSGAVILGFGLFALLSLKGILPSDGGDFPL